MQLFAQKYSRAAKKAYQLTEYIKNGEKNCNSKRCVPNDNSYYDQVILHILQNCEYKEKGGSNGLRWETRWNL